MNTPWNACSSRYSFGFFGPIAESDRKPESKDLYKECYSDCKVTKDVLEIADSISLKLEEPTSSDNSIFIDSDRDGVTDRMTEASKTTKREMALGTQSGSSDAASSRRLSKRKKSSRTKDVQASPSNDRITRYLKGLNIPESSPQKHKKAVEKLSVSVKTEPGIKEELVSSDEDPSGIFSLSLMEEGVSPQIITSDEKTFRYEGRSDVTEGRSVKRELIQQGSQSANTSAVSESELAGGVLDWTKTEIASNQLQSNFLDAESDIDYEDAKDKELWVIQAPVDYDIGQLSNQVVVCSGVQDLKGLEKDGCHYELHTAGENFTQKLHPFLPTKQIDCFVPAQTLSGQLQVIRRMKIPHLPNITVPAAKKHVIPPKLLPVQRPFGSKSPLRDDTDARKSLIKKKKRKHESPLRDDTDAQKSFIKKKKRKHERQEMVLENNEVGIIKKLKTGKKKKKKKQKES